MKYALIIVLVLLSFSVHAQEPGWQPIGGTPLSPPPETSPPPIGPTPLGGTDIR